MSIGCRGRVVAVAAVAAVAGLTACGAAPAADEGRAESPARPSPTAGTPSEQQPRRTPDPEPTEAELDRARREVAQLSLEEKAGQVLMATYPGLDAPTDLVERHHLGGVIVMGDNIDSAEQIGAVNATLQDEGRDWPLLIGVDQEGGQIARLGSPLTEFPTYLTFGAARDPALATDAARASGTELRALGFTMVFAPVADVTSGPEDPTIGSRSAGGDPDVVATTAAGSLAGYTEAGIVPVLKHFPGHGSVPADSHETLPVQDATLDELRERDLVPFERLVDAPAVMVAHIDVAELDPGTPSSLSSEVVDGLLREELGFDGLVITDALNMAAIADAYGSGEAAVRALLAGNDLLLMPEDVAAAHDAIVEAVESGRVPENRLDQAATRVVATALHQDAVAGEPPSVDVLGAATDTSYAASLAAATIASGPCGRQRHVGDTVQIVGGTATDRERFAGAAEDADLEVGTSGDVVRLLGPGEPAGPGDVVVALDVPYALGDADADSVAIGLYGRTPQAFEALAAVLTGEEAATGTLPVEAGGVERAGCPADER